MTDKLNCLEEFDLALAFDCARSFHDVAGIGCTVSDVSGVILSEEGYGCSSCAICSCVDERGENCTQAHIYGMTEAERFGGKYIYFCPMGLTCFVSPIVGQSGSAAKITVGPFIMGDMDDYIAYELDEKRGLNASEIERLCETLKSVPLVTPARVQSLSNLLFMSVGFLNNVSAANRMLDTQSFEMISGQISAYIMELKQHETPPEYPLDDERALVESIIHKDKERSQELLNKILGFILFSSGGDVGRIKTRIYELLVVMSRAAIDAGASPDQTFARNHDFITRCGNLSSVDDLYLLISEVMVKTIESVFQFMDIRHIDVIHKAVNYVQHNYAKRITLEEMARRVYLSPSYFSKVFKQEMGCSFGNYLNQVRIEKSKKLLNANLKLVEVASLVGFEDQSYYTKVFKRVVGVPPTRYSEIVRRGGQK